MPAPTHTPQYPAATGGVDIRLRWWALALPVLAFVVLFLMVLNPSDAHAAGDGAEIGELIEYVRQLLAR